MLILTKFSRRKENQRIHTQSCDFTNVFSNAHKINL
eukprot:UN16665